MVKNPPASTGDTGDAGSIPGSGTSPGGKKWQATPSSFPENPTDRRAWEVTVHGVTKSQT